MDVGTEFLEAFAAELFAVGDEVVVVLLTGHRFLS